MKRFWFIYVKLNKLFSFLWSQILVIAHIFPKCEKEANWRTMWGWKMTRRFPYVLSSSTRIHKRWTWHLTFDLVCQIKRLVPLESNGKNEARWKIICTIETLTRLDSSQPHVSLRRLFKCRQNGKPTQAKRSEQGFERKSTICPTGGLAKMFGSGGRLRAWIQRAHRAVCSARLTYLTTLTTSSLYSCLSLGHSASLGMFWLCLPSTGEFQPLLYLLTLIWCK